MSTREELICVSRADLEAIGKFLPGFVEAMNKLEYIQRVTEEYKAAKHEAREAAAQTRREIVERLKSALEADFWERRDMERLVRDIEREEEK